MEQLTIFDVGREPLKIDKPIRLIECFGGVGSQAKALTRLGANFEHYRLSEWEVSAVASYKAIHMNEDNTDYSEPYSNEDLTDLLLALGISTDGKSPLKHKDIARRSEQWKRTVFNNFKATNNIGSIVNICGKDLGIVDTYKYCYILTYSFPCQDLSLAGKQKLMAKGSNTRSSLLWEVERLLNECDELPQVLLMENVTQVHGKKNLDHFVEWCNFLESKGYANYWQDLNAKNYGIPQNRNRTFMVSVLGDYTYEFPKEFPLELRLKDMLEESVDEKYYLSTKQLNYAIDLSNTQKGTEWEGRADSGKLNPIVAMTLGVRSAGGGQRCGVSNFVIDGVDEEVSVAQFKDSLSATPSVNQIGNLFESKTRKNPNNGRLYDQEGLSPTLGAMEGGNRQPFVIDKPTINRIDIPQTVRVRKYEVDCKLLCEMLRDHKSASGFNNQDIADHLNVPLTKVEHWFRQDKYFAIPDDDIWLDLKALLGIETDEFDEAIMAFEEKEGVFEKSNRCYLSDGLAPTITSGSADEKVIEPLAYDEQNGYIRTDGTVGTLTTDGSSPKHNNRVIVGVANKKGYDEAYEGDSINLEQPNSKTRRGRVGHGVAQTLNTAPQQAVVEPLGVWDGYNQRVRAESTTVGTLTQNCGADLKRNCQGIIERTMRIRKLTPRECFRLMGFDDTDFDKAEQCNSNAQLYKQAGNSIVVNVLVEIFKKML